MCKGFDIAKSPMRATFALLCCCALLIAIGTLSGCKESDAIIERIYDQTSSNVDYDNPEKLYISDDESPDTNDSVETGADDDAQWEDVVEYDLPDSVGSEDVAPISKTEYREQTASTAVAPRAREGGETQQNDVGGGTAPSTENAESTQPEWSDIPPEPEPDPQNPPPQADNNGDNHGGNQGPTNQQTGPEQGIKPVDPDDDTYLGRVYDSTYGDLEDLPTNVSTIAATGELATIVQVVGGEGALVGSSADYLGNPAIQDVFANKGIANVAVLWDGDGEPTSQSDAEAIIRANPDACVVYSGQLDADLERLILQNRPDMAVITLPKPTSAANIFVEFQTIGRLLSESSNGASETRVTEYLDFVNDIVNTAEAAHGGGEATYASVDYNNNDNTNLLLTSNPASSLRWSLYISGWDDDAMVTALYESSVLFEDMGAAYTRTGWSWSPLSYYMSVGGVINNAAAYGPLSTEQLQPVLTLNQNQVSYRWQNFCVKTDERKGGGSYTNYRAYYTLTNARDAVDRGGINPNELHALGSEDFDTVIVKTSRIADALIAARQNENGLYTLYPYETTVSGSGYGRKYEGTHGQSIVYSTVKGDVEYRILVNPCGYVGSWTDGSIEAPLEALWIANEFCSLDYQTLVNFINEFYGKFYDGYTPDIDAILNGSYAHEDDE